MIVRTGVVMCALALSGCLGYSPLYSEATQENLHNVYVQDVTMREIERRQGERRVAQLVTQQLERTLTGPKGAPYTLAVSLHEEVTTLAVRRDASELRSQLNLTGYVTLYSTTQEAPVFDVRLQESAAYNVEDTPFSTESGKERARASASKSLSEQISQRIAQYFHHLENTK